jgi:excisionase family DNA binding protein
MQLATSRLEVTYPRTTSVKPDPRNPRVHSLIDDEQKVIAGHGRLLAARKLGWETVPAIRLSHLTVEYAGQPLKAGVVIQQRDASLAACHRAFREVVSRYQEIKESPDRIKALNYEKACTSGHATKASSFVRPSNSDFIADVEISAKRCLTPVELQYFTRWYKSCVVVDLDCVKKHIDSFHEKYRASAAVIDKRVRTKLGSRLIEVGISPFSEYVREVDVRKIQRKTKSKYDESDPFASLPKEPLSAVLERVFGCADESNLLEWPEENSFSIQASAAPSPTISIADRIEEYEHALTVRELATLLGCSTRQIYELVQDKRLPALMIGTSIRLDPRQTADWIRSKMTIAAFAKPALVAICRLTA